MPETIKEAKECVSQEDEAITWQSGEDGYKYVESLSVHGNVPQRWLLVFSEHAYAPEKKSLEKKLSNVEAQLRKDIERLGGHVFGCGKDAEESLSKLAKEYPLYRFQGQLIPEKKYARKGKPAAGDVPAIVGYKFDLVLERNEEAVRTLLNKLDKEVRNPTLRWIFQIMEGLGIARIEGSSGAESPASVRELVTNMTSLRKKIIRLFGPTACRMHGLNPESAF